MNTNRAEVIQSFFESMSTMHRSLMANRDSFLRSLGINRPQFEVLCLFFHQKEITVKEIAESMHVTSSAATQLVDRLVKEGFLVRETDPHDRRVVCVKLSDEGKAKIKHHKKQIFAHLLKRMDGITDEELQSMVTVAKRIANAQKAAGEK